MELCGCKVALLISSLLSSSCNIYSRVHPLLKVIFLSGFMACQISCIQTVEMKTIDLFLFLFGFYSTNIGGSRGSLLLLEVV